MFVKRTFPHNPALLFCRGLCQPRTVGDDTLRHASPGSASRNHFRGPCFLVRAGRRRSGHRERRADGP